MATFRNWPLLVILVFQLFCTNMFACALLTTTTATTHSTTSDVKFSKSSVIDSDWHPVPHEFGVYFHDGHTLEKHWKHIGRELPIFRYPTVLTGYKIKFGSADTRNPISSETEILALIRSDPGVELVAQNFWQQLDLGDGTPLPYQPSRIPLLFSCKPGYRELKCLENASPYDVRPEPSCRVY
ncbi:hypothetical protein M438DRAFT_339872 [Aureobasidium pullulans EXF-150]|uniref:Uncharacterized protein n=1 Tax=Aureobasidium pullulans EXF-150 TaxID=1043002 RepID=A0A074X1F3_AURPU|nr:uncharacterized protein M438DRAFT_339872 [Aureobasidium pullulans EXF-150]KEQ79280.1 hypothetical protein M438DRAFT_339872 [Aureobasidium pullulans EXF-150]THY93854.1 hypothetical protein D6C92_05175 [Aureobasidium pullulans]TIA23329.1 hypothetical protein D6C81_02952 [Aureobasidium pullulans]